MAAVAEMGEVDDIHSKDDNVTDGVLMNGDISEGEKPSDMKELVVEKEEDLMEVEEYKIEEDEEDEEDEDDEDEECHEVDDKEDEMETCSNTGTVNSIDENSDEVHNVDDNSDDDVEITKDGSESDPLCEQNDSVVVSDTVDLDADADGDADVVIVENDSVKENGTSTPEKDACSIIESEVTPVKSNPGKKEDSITPRRSSRNLNKSRSYILDSDKEASGSEESDIEEVMPQDPLAVSDPLLNDKGIKKIRSTTSTIVVKDTKRLVEIASKSAPGNAGKKEPTLVIIDTNSILSGRGPIPINQKPSMPPSYPVLPVALPAQGMYPANMRATITPIPMNNPTPKPPPPAPAPVSVTPQAPILPSLTDDMFVVEAPSFIVPYVYEKPPVKDLKNYVKTVADEIKKLDEEEKRREEEREKEEKEKEKENEKDGENADEKDEVKEDEKKKNSDGADSKKPEDVTVETIDVDDKKEEDKNKRHTYFDSPIGKFFVEIGSGLVQEFVQTDLLKQQKRKRDREGGQNSATNKTITSLLKSLEYTKENNQPYKMSMKKCEFCSYKTESALAMAFHLETPHMKNFVYRCNFCPYEVRSPHDILFHMEAEHCVRGRLERAPAFHQCPNCPFEDNQKGKLSRHSVACARKFKAERNLEPPIDWEPPAKIPRAPRMKQQSLSTTAAMYQAMAKTSQIQFMKMQQNMAQSAMNRGRGRPSLGMTSKQQSVRSQDVVYKQAVPGGASVLVPTNYQISGNQLYQVVGGQDLGGRIGGPMGLLPTMSTSSTVTIQNSPNKPKTVHQPSISITPLPRGSATGGSSSTNSPSSGMGGAKPGDSNSKNSFVICEICDGYIKDLEQLRNHMQWIHKVKIHPKMIYNRPPLNCQKCQFRFFTDQGLERHLLGSHGLVTSSMQEAANKCKDSGRCPVCGRVYQWKLLNHVARDHNMTLKPAHLSYKCTVCTATFGMYKQFENHVYSAHSVVAKRSIDKKTNSPSKSESLLKPLKINDEITIIPQMPKSNGAGSSKEGSPSTSSKSSSNASTPGTSKIGDTSISRAERLARRKTSLVGDN